MLGSYTETVTMKTAARLSRRRRAPNLTAELQELEVLGDPDFPGIERLPIRPRVATAPIVERP